VNVIPNDAAQGMHTLKRAYRESTNTLILWIKKSSRGINKKILSDQKHIIHYSPSVVAVLTVTVAVAIPIAVAVLAAPVAAAVP